MSTLAPLPPSNYRAMQGCFQEEQWEKNNNSLVSLGPGTMVITAAGCTQGLGTQAPGRWSCCSKSTPAASPGMDSTDAVTP